MLWIKYMPRELTSKLFIFNILQTNEHDVTCTSVTNSGVVKVLCLYVFR